MSPGVPFSEDLSRIRYELELFHLGGAFELFEDDRPLGIVERGCSEAGFAYGKLVLSCWGDGWSRSWRVVACQPGPDRLLLRCVKKIGLVTSILELRRGEAEHQQSREEFSGRLASLIESSLPGLRVERVYSARDDRLHLSASHTRLAIKDRGRIIAAVGAGSREPQTSIDQLLGAGLIWLEALRRQTLEVDRLMLFAPKGRATTIATRLTAVRAAGAIVSLFEIDEGQGHITPVEPFDQGDLMDNYRRFARRAVWPRPGSLNPETSSLIDSIVRLAPGEIEIRQRSGVITLSLRGLEFARVSASSRQCRFGLFERKRLGPDNFGELAGLVEELMSNRRAEPADRNDWLYRVSPERWLESIIRRDITSVDPLLDPRRVYSQVPAYRGEQRGYIDVLTATRTGRLVVIELKASEDIDFPFQGLDYWLRVEWHRLRGDFERRGYFADMKIEERPPLLFLVAPIFTFHATTGLLAGSIVDRAQVYRIGINEDWQSGVRTLLHEKLN